MSMRRHSLLVLTAVALVSPVQAEVTNTLSARVTSLEERLAAAEAALNRITVQQAGAQAAWRQAAFVAAALNLQAAVATSRPWQRDYETLASLGGPARIPVALAETLQRHGSQGVPGREDLREYFAELAPYLLLPATRREGPKNWMDALWRSAARSVGFASNSPTPASGATVTAIREHLRRGNLAAALSEAGALDASQQRFIARWLEQVRARLAVEQAALEILHRAIGAASLVN